MNQALFDPSTSQNCTENFRPMVTARILVYFWSTTKLTRHHNKGRIKQPALFEITNQGREGLVKGRKRAIDALLHFLMHIPTAIGHCDKANPGFHKSSGEKHSLPGLVTTIFIPQVFRLSVDIKRCLRFRRTHEVVRSLIEAVHRHNVV